MIVCRLPWSRCFGRFLGECDRFGSGLLDRLNIVEVRLIVCRLLGSGSFDRFLGERERLDSGLLDRFSVIFRLFRSCCEKRVTAVYAERGSGQNRRAAIRAGKLFCRFEQIIDMLNDDILYQFLTANIAERIADAERSTAVRTARDIIGFFGKSGAIVRFGRENRLFGSGFFGRFLRERERFGSGFFDRLNAVEVRLIVCRLLGSGSFGRFLRERERFGSGLFDRLNAVEVRLIVSRLLGSGSFGRFLRERERFGSGFLDRLNIVEVRLIVCRLLGSGSFDRFLRERERFGSGLFERLRANFRLLRSRFGQNLTAVDAETIFRTDRGAAIRTIRVVFKIKIV